MNRAPILVIDGKSGKRRDDPRVANVSAFIGWRRIIAALKQSGDLRPHETVDALILTEDGIDFRVKT